MENKRRVYPMEMGLLFIMPAAPSASALAILLPGTTASIGLRILKHLMAYQPPRALGRCTVSPLVQRERERGREREREIEREREKGMGREMKERKIDVERGAMEGKKLCITEN